jgi:hypothetical protein
MRIFCEGVLMVSMAALLAGSGLAQGPPFGGTGAPSDPAALLRHESVQMELKLHHREQQGQVQQALQKVLKKHQKDLDKLRDLPEEKRAKQIEQLRRTISEESMKAIRGVLQLQQIQRLEQIDLQHQGMRAFDDPRVQKKLQLTNEQKTQIKTIDDQAQQEVRKLLQKGDFRIAREKMTALRKEALDKAQAVLHDDQKKDWKELIGEPFNLPFASPPGGKR